VPRAPREKIVNSFLFIKFFLGLFLIVIGILWWLESGMPLEGIMPHKNNFGRNPLHLSFLGGAIMAYVLFEHWRRNR
jgi:hypothetical protein